MGIVPIIFLAPYLAQRGVSPETLGSFVQSDPVALLIQVAATLPAHLLTLGLAWLLVTRAGKYPFLASLGWGWGRGFNLWTSTLAAIVLVVLGVSIIWLTGSPKTPLDKLLDSSRATALTTAFVATFTAPLVEEIIYRGVLYSALQRAIGAVWAVVFVFALFALVHVPQYVTSLGAITAILILSLFLTFVRAYTGQLLPCVVIHLVFNGIQSFFIVFGPYLEKASPQQTATAAAFLRLTFGACWPG